MPRDWVPTHTRTWDRGIARRRRESGIDACFYIVFAPALHMPASAVLVWIVPCIPKQAALADVQTRNDLPRSSVPQTMQVPTTISQSQLTLHLGIPTPTSIPCEGIESTFPLKHLSTYNSNLNPQKNLSTLHHQPYSAPSSHTCTTETLILPNPEIAPNYPKTQRLEK